MGEYKIGILDTLALGDDVDLSKFDLIGDVANYKVTTPEQIYDRCKDLDFVLTNKVVFGKEQMDMLPKLRYIGINATGTNNVDLEYAKKKGITVTNIRSYSTDSVVQHTFALMFYIFEKLRHYDDFVKNGDYCKWQSFTYFGQHFAELKGKTWGIIGLGEIGRGVADVAKAFGCNVIYYSTSGRNSNPNYKQVDWDTLLAESDIISIHAPLTPATEGLMNAEAFRKMKNTAIMINVGRGPIVVEQDLVDALNNDEIAGAALDVVSVEPIRPENPLLTFKDSNRLIITPHIAWAGNETRQRLMDEAYENLAAFVRGEKRSVVNE